MLCLRADVHPGGLRLPEGPRQHRHQEGARPRPQVQDLRAGALPALLCHPQQPLLLTVCACKGRKYTCPQQPAQCRSPACSLWSLSIIQHAESTVLRSTTTAAALLPFRVHRKRLTPLQIFAPQVCKCLRFSGVSVPRGYEEGFQRALWTFRHQRVYCPHRRRLVHLRDLPPGALTPQPVFMWQSGPWDRQPQSMDPLACRRPGLQAGLSALTWRPCYLHKTILCNKPASIKVAGPQ